MTLELRIEMLFLRIAHAEVGNQRPLPGYFENPDNFRGLEDRDPR